MILKLHGHIGSTASALVDGQLSPQEEDRAWAHVLTCPGCRRLVEREGWVKQRLAGLAAPTDTQVPHGLASYLHGMDAWARVDELERQSVRRRAAGALVGAGAVGVAALAVVALTSAPASRNEVPVDRAPATLRPDVVGASLQGAGASCVSSTAVACAAR